MQTHLTIGGGYGWLRAASIAASALATMWAPHTAGAQDYPARTVRIIIPISPGGATDILTRTLAARLATVWRQQVELGAFIRREIARWAEVVKIANVGAD